MSHESSITTKPAGRRLGIKGKLLGTSLVLLAFTALIGVLGIRASSTISGQSDRMYTENVVPLADVGIARAKFSQERANHLLETDSAKQDALVAALKEDDKTVAEKLLAVSRSLKLPEGKAAVRAGPVRRPGVPGRPPGRAPAVGRGP